MPAWKSAGILTTLFFSVFLPQGCSKQEELPKVRLWALAPPETTSSQPASPPPLHFAVALTISPQAGYQLYRDFAEVLGRKINGSVQVVLRGSLSEVNDLIRSRQADMALLCARGFLQGHAGFGLTALAVPELRGWKSYPSYIVVPAESEIASLSQLTGKTMAFADPLCTPEPFPLLGPGRFPIRYHDRAINAIAEGLADGALVDGFVYTWMALKEPAKMQQSKVVGQTARYINPPLAVHPRMDATLKDNLRAALLTLHQDERGQAVLAKLGIDRFVTPVERQLTRPESEE